MMRYIGRTITLLSVIAVAVTSPESSVYADEPAVEPVTTFTVPERPASVPSDEELEHLGAVVGNIELKKYDVFDTSLPGENKSLYRLANRLHVETRDSVILNQLLLEPGQPYSSRLVAESERILRNERYLYDARIVPVHYANGVVDLAVITRDVWTLNLGFSGSRSGGQNKTDLEIEELNLLGTGSRLGLRFRSDIDRDSTILQYQDKHLGDSWVSMSLLYADNSDGSGAGLVIERPFYALDTRWAAGFSYFDEESIESLYDLGDKLTEYSQTTRDFKVYGGLSKGWQNGWVRRWTAGIGYESREFAGTVDEPVPLLMPENRELVYPFIALDIIEDKYRTVENHDQIDRTEDFNLGDRYKFELGWAAKGFGSDRDALLYKLTADRGWGKADDRMLLASAYASGRFEGNNNANSIVGMNVRYYHQRSEKSLFYASLGFDVSHDLDVDNPLLLGGENGLRGFPLRYQSGNARALLTVEQRYYTDWYPLRLFRVGGAIFVDVGRAWGTNPLGGSNLGALADAGFGLRLGSTRSGKGKVVHIDIAFPINADPSLDSVQFIIEGKKGF